MGVRPERALCTLKPLSLHIGRGIILVSEQMQASTISQGEHRRGLGAFVSYSRLSTLPGSLETPASDMLAAHSNQVGAKYGKYLQDVCVNIALSMISVTRQVSTNKWNNSIPSLLEIKSYKSKFSAGQM